MHFSSLLRAQWAALCLLTLIRMTTCAEDLPLERLPTTAQLAADRAKNARQPLAFDPSRNTWRAQVIATPGAMPAKEATDICRQYRTEFTLSAVPVAAALCINTAPSFDLYINGQLAKREHGGWTMSRALYSYDDLQGLLHEGRNTILIEAGIHNWFGPLNTLIVEGMARDASGLVSHLTSDAAWQTRYLTTGHSETQDPWEPAQVLGPVARLDFPQPPYFGRIAIGHPGRRCPIFDSTAPVAYDLTVFAPDLVERFDVAVRVLDTLDHDRVVHEGVVAQDQAPGIQRLKLTWTAPQPGVYDIEVSLRGQRSGKQLDQRVMETAVVGPIAQTEIDGKNYAEGLDLRLVDQIDCTDPADPHPFISRDRLGAVVPSRIVDAPFGRYRTCGDGYGYLAWKIEVKDPTRAHLMEIDYPDDATRIINVSIGANTEIHGDIPNDVGERLWNKVGSGVYTGFEHPVSNSMKTLRLVYWPGEPVGGVTIASDNPGPAAVAKIRLYEIANDLPALRRPFPAQRFTGRHTERLSVLASAFYSGEDGAAFSEHLRLRSFRGFYKDWYQTNANLIRYMRFTGENLVVPGVHMYAGNYPPAEYPSPSAAYAGGNAATADPLELMARMLASNGLSLYLGVEYGSPPELYSAGFLVSDEEVAAGARTVRFVDRNGHQAPASFCTSLNIFAPEVESGLHRMIGELCELYKDTPGILGMHLQEGESLLPSLWADQTALRGVEGMAVDDLTIGQFERDTGVTVPADRIGVQRFAQRDDWLNQHAHQQWIDWRCQRIHGINAAMMARLRSANPKWKLSIAMLPRAVQGGPQHSFLEALKVQGFDPTLYSDPGMELQFGTNPQWVRRQVDDTGLWQLGRQMNRDPEILAAFTTNGHVAQRQVGGGFYEPELRAPSAGWYWDKQMQIPYPLPVERNILDGYNATLLDALPQTLFQHWLDVNGLFGNEQIMRGFNRAFTSLPVGGYRTLSGSGFSGNLIVRAADSGLYVINPLPVRVTAVLSFTGDGTVADLATGVHTPAGHGVELTLDSYGIAAFRLDHAGPSALIEQPLPPGITERITAQFATARPVVATLRKRVTVDDDAQMRRFLALADEIERELAAAAVGRARLVLDGGEWKSLLALAVDRAEPQCWSVIGPFDNAERKAFTTVLPVESDILSGAGVKPSYAAADGIVATWHQVLARSQGDHRGLVDFAELFSAGPTDFKLGYAVARIRSDHDFTGELWVGSDDSLAVWVNGAEVSRITASRSAVPDSNKVPVQLQRGENLVLFKLDNGIGGWAFFCDIRDQQGARATGLEFVPMAAR